MPPDVMLRLGFVADPPSVTLIPEAGLRDFVWLRLRGEFGADAVVDANRIVVPAEVFLSLAPVLRAFLKRHRVRVLADEGVTALLTSVRNLAAAFHSVSGGSSPPSLSPDEVLERLESGRFKRVLKDFQLRDVARLLALPHGANFSVPGAGKTTVALATYEAERASGRVERLLVIGPLSSFDAWNEEARECFSGNPLEICQYSGEIGPTCEILLANYQRLSHNRVAIARWLTSAPCHLILDEAHRIKRGWGGQWGRACLSLAYFAERRDVLTGTPAPQGPEDVLALMDFLWPNVGRRALPDSRSLRKPSGEVLSAVSRTLKPFYVRTGKTELGLRAPEFSAILLPLQGLHREIYLALKDQYSGVFDLGRPDRVSFADLGKVVMYLIEAATNPSLLVAGSSRWDPVVFRHPPLAVPTDGRLIELLRSFSDYATPAKFEMLGRIVRENADRGRKTLVWSNFVRNISTLERMLERFRPAVIHGGVPLEARGDQRDRVGELRRFRSDQDCMVMLANPAAAGEGVSLHRTCHDAVYLDRTFNAGQYLQSVDRIHRLGLPPEQDTRVTFLIMKDTVDETIDRRVREKATRMGAILDDPGIAAMALPDEEDYGPPVDSDQDVLELFAHLRGDEHSSSDQ
jgi:SNF2-related domain/Helicase conserved C-terminal domain